MCSTPMADCGTAHTNHWGFEYIGDILKCSGPLELCKHNSNSDTILVDIFVISRGDMIAKAQMTQDQFFL